MNQIPVDIVPENRKIICILCYLKNIQHFMFEIYSIFEWNIFATSWISEISFPKCKNKSKMGRLININLCLDPNHYHFFLNCDLRKELDNKELDLKVRYMFFVLRSSGVILDGAIKHFDKQPLHSVDFEMLLVNLRLHGWLIL